MEDEERRRQAIRNHQLGLDRVDFGEPRLPPKREQAPEYNDNEISLALRASWRYLDSWLHQYTLDNPVPGAAATDYYGRHTASTPMGKRFEAEVEITREPGLKVPLLEFRAFEHDANCDVTIRLNEKASAAYFRSLLLAIADVWSEAGATVYAHVARLPSSPERPEHPQVADNKARLHQLWVAGRSRLEAADALGVSESTVKRMSREMGLDWRPSKPRK